MGKNELTKVEALKLITPVVDNEVSDDERQAFMNYITEHEDVRRKYESIKKIKDLVHSRCPCAKAPDSLKDYIKSVCCQKSAEIQDSGPPIYDVPCHSPGKRSTDYRQTEVESSEMVYRRWGYAVAASLLIAAVIWGFFNYSSFSDSGPIYNVEEYAYQHFADHRGQFIPPTISTASLGSAEVQLASNYDMSMTVPAIRNAEFKGVVFADFVPRYKAPMLEYYIPAEDQYIYIFAFKLDKLKHFGHLVRDSEAIKTCTKPNSYHIRNVKGKHVVSWKWNDVWYAAVSNHDGNTLASLVKPLQKDQ